MSKGGKFTYMFDVVDKESKKTILVGVNGGEIEKKIGLPKHYVTPYYNRGMAFKNRYILINKRIDKSLSDRARETKEIKEGWEDMRIAAYMLKTGQGRLVRKGREKYVEAIK